MHSGFAILWENMLSSNFSWQLCIIRSCSIQRSTLQLQKCVSNASLRLDIDLMKVEVNEWMTILNYWLKLSLFRLGLAPLTMIFNPHGKVVATKISFFGFYLGLLFTVEYDEGKTLIADTGCQLDPPSQVPSLYFQWTQQVLCLSHDILNQPQIT